MAQLLTIDKDLVIRNGLATYQLTRQIENGQTLIFENQKTGGMLTIEFSKFYSNIQAGKYSVIFSSETKTLLNDKGNVNAVISDLSALPEKTLQELKFRHGLVKYFQKAQISKGQRSKIADGIQRFYAIHEIKEKKPSTSTAMTWMRRYEGSSRNVNSLLSGNTYRRRKTIVNEKIEETVFWALDAHYLKRSRPTLRFAFEQLQEKIKELVDAGKLNASEQQISYATFQRRKTAIPQPYLLNKRYGEAYATHKLRSTMDGSVACRSMQRYEVDHTPLNWVVVCDRTGLPLGRPTLTVVVDTYSGYVVGMYVSFNGPSLTAVMNVIKNCIRPKDDIVLAAETENPWIAVGLPEGLILDNGMEFHAHSLRLAALELSVDIDYCRVRMPLLKPKVERFFADLDQLPLEAGRIYKPIANVLNIDPKKDASITLSALCKGLVLFVCDIHNQHPNSRTLQKPFDIFAESLETNPAPIMPLSMAGLDMIAAISKESVVAQGGVEFYGLNYGGYAHKELMEDMGGKFKTLIKWDPDNLESIYVRHPKTGAWVTLTCTRPDYANGLSWNQHKLVKDFNRNSLKLNGSVENLLRAKARLRDEWLNPIAKKNEILDFKKAKKFAGQMASAATFCDEQKEFFVQDIQPKRLLAIEELSFPDEEIPLFETIKFR